IIRRCFTLAVRSQRNAVSLVLPFPAAAGKDLALAAGSALADPGRDVALCRACAGGLQRVRSRLVSCRRRGARGQPRRALWRLAGRPVALSLRRIVVVVGGVPRLQPAVGLSPPEEPARTRPPLLHLRDDR